MSLEARYLDLRGAADAKELTGAALTLSCNSLRKDLQNAPPSRARDCMLQGLSSLGDEEEEEEEGDELDSLGKLCESLEKRFDEASERCSRLVVFDRLATEEDESKRRALWDSLGSVYDSLTAAGVYTQLMALASEAPLTSLNANLDALGGIEKAELEAWFSQVLGAWDSLTQHLGPVEPWNWEYRNCAAVQVLDGAVPRREDLVPITLAFYKSLGAKVDGITFDLDERPDKSQVACCDFGDRRVEGNRPIISANYRYGGFGNLVELVHETGHAGNASLWDVSKCPVT